MKNLIKFTCMGLAMMLAFNMGPASAQKAPKRSITKISGDLYRFQNNFHYSVFYVTDEGVLVTDPINTRAAKWLKAEIKKRFNKPIKYLVYSHDHQDHSSGGEVFEGATVIGHEKTRDTMIGEKRPTAVQTLTLSDQMTINIGGKQIEITYVSLGHSDNSIVMRFPAERAMFVVDFISVKRLAFKTLSETYVLSLIEAIRTVKNMDFDTILPGHGKTGKRQDLKDHGDYIEDLYNAVLGGMRADKSLDDVKSSIKLPKYEKWAQYKAWLPLNIEGMYSRIQNQRRATK
ncbi:MAG: MBL fold metallo-hydrolase [Alphaproteobacteria bacterium]